VRARALYGGALAERGARPKVPKAVVIRPGHEWAGHRAGQYVRHRVRPSGSGSVFRQAARPRAPNTTPAGGSHPTSTRQRLNTDGDDEFLTLYARPHFTRRRQ
jgi:hypothetical protein